MLSIGLRSVFNVGKPGSSRVKSHSDILVYACTIVLSLTPVFSWVIIEEVRMWICAQYVHQLVQTCKCPCQHEHRRTV